MNLPPGVVVLSHGNFAITILLNFYTTPSMQVLNGHGDLTHPGFNPHVERTPSPFSCNSVILKESFNFFPSPNNSRTTHPWGISHTAALSSTISQTFQRSFFPLAELLWDETLREDSVHIPLPFRKLHSSSLNSPFVRVLLSLKWPCYAPSPGYSLTRFLTNLVTPPFPVFL